MKGRKPSEQYSIKEIAAFFGVSYGVIKRAIDEGDLVASQVGKVYRISEEDFEAYKELCKKRAAN